MEAAGAATHVAREKRRSMADEAEARSTVEQTTLEVETLAAIPGDGRAGVAPDGGARRLVSALDTLDERLTFLLARYARLAERLSAAESARREAEERLQQVATGELDPIALEERTRQLASENERLARHASYLEERVESLLARVRYVVES